ncbi:MAG TPA: YjbH domain-containing protein [Rhizomicrobium sp.]|nr:YjbH domain-containing protein [Rhizomicrobium sp.]
MALLLAGAASAVLTGLPGPAHADDDQPLSRNIFGSPGLVDMPSARMMPDGNLSMGASFFKNTQHYNFGFQVLPWLETSFRYSGLSHFDPAFPVYYDRSFAFKARLWDETDLFPAFAIGVDDIIGTGIYSGEYIVATKGFGDVDATVGMGWGRLGSTGTLKNPLGMISRSFLTPRELSAAGGTNFNTLFHGPRSGIFGGLSWRTPLDGLVLSAEYSSDAYSLEESRGTFRPRSQVNFGAAYEAFDHMTLSLDWLYGESIGGGITFDLDPVHDPYPQRMGAPPLPPNIRTPEQQQQAINRLAGRGFQTADLRSGALVDALWNAGIAAEDMAIRGRTLTIRAGQGDPRTLCRKAASIVADYGMSLDGITVVRAGSSARCAVPQLPALQTAAFAGDEGATNLYHLVQAPVITIDAAAPPAPSRSAATAAIRKDSDSQQIHIEALALNDSEAVVYYTNYRYLHEKDAVDRLTRILMADAPPDIEKFRLIATDGGVPEREFDILRSPTERSIEQTGTYDILDGGNSTQPAPMHNPVLAAAAGKNYPRFNWSVFPQFRQELFDPDNPLAVQFLGAATASVELLPGLTLMGEGEVNLYDNFNTLRPADSALPHVRSDFLTYFTKGKNGIGDLELNYRFRLAPEVFAMARVGYLESMFAGVGGEVLWRPENMRWAVGGDLYEVKQRAFDRLFGFRDYSVLTGHVSMYYASPWYGLNFAVHVGQYLAGDRGFTFEATRRFDSGVEIGAFFTRTNVSAQQFGEGSFDKGIIIRIPIGWMAPINTQAQFNMDLRPVQRDGGQRLAGDTLLYEQTRMTSTAAIIQPPDSGPSQ